MRKSPSSGFSLIELMITIAVVAFVVGIGIPRLSGRKTEVQSLIRKLAVLSRDIKYRAKLQGSTYRLVLKISDENEDGEFLSGETPPSQYWVEKAPGSVILDSQADDKDSDDKDDPGEDSPPDPKAFAIASQLTKEPQTLPEGLVIRKIELAQQKDPVEKGTIYIYYLPAGPVTEAAIHLEFNEKQKWTLVTHPLTGKIDIFNEEVSLDTLKQ